MSSVALSGFLTGVASPDRLAVCWSDGIDRVRLGRSAVVRVNEAARGIGTTDDCSSNSCESLLIEPSSSFLLSG